MVKIRRLAKSITSLEVENSIVTDQASIAASIVKHLEDSFTRDPLITDTGLVERVIPSLVTDDENSLLTSMPSRREIWETIRAMDDYSSPGPDGFGGSFYVHCWSIISDDVVSAIQSFFSKVSSRYQLQAFGFCNRFITFIHNILKSAHLSICVNGETNGYFICSQGVRQGDPLSPLLFCLAEDGRKKHLRALLHFLDEYALNSGQVLSKGKSTFFIGSSHSRRQEQIQNVLGINRGSLPFNYLGVPFFIGRPKSEFLLPIADKSLASQLNIDERHHSFLDAKVSDYIIDGDWVLPEILSSAHHVIAQSILRFPLSLGKDEDQVIWSGMSLSDYFDSSHLIGFSPSSKLFWYIVGCNLLWCIWFERNRIKHEEGVFSPGRFHWFFTNALLDFARLAFKPADLNASNLPIFKLLGLSLLRATAPRFTPVSWRPPDIPWVKVNIDGSFRSTNQVGYGGVFRNHTCLFIGAFAKKIEASNALETKLWTFIDSVTIAWNRGWHDLWIETLIYGGLLLQQFF
ncbi:hypothetical protein ACLB2K_037014 [Fragaria x ananassa]